MLSGRWIASRPNPPRASRTASICLALVALLAAMPARAQIRPTQQPPQRGKLKVSVDLVSVFTSVLDAAGKPIADLPRQDFHLYQDGKEQQIDLFERQTNMPLDLVLMIDTSLSAMGDMKFEVEAAQHFVHQILRPGDQLAVFTFAYDVTQLSPFTGSLQTLDAAFKRVRLGTGTSLFDAIYLGAQALDQLPPDRRRVLLLVTDAGETTSRTSYDGARDAAIRSGVMLYTILIRVVKSESGRNTAGEHAIDTIIDSTGGAMYPVDVPAQFASTFDRINEELRTEYLLGFYPKPAPPPGSHHTILVRLATPGPPGGQPYAVRYRKEYFTPGTSQ
ncbi:MAG: VWA domain-containing protein [Acidobacteriota bacterium]|nr:VWA domain-containing protein [Acidobacteriota bacterium]